MKQNNKNTPTVLPPPPIPSAVEQLAQLKLDRMARRKAFWQTLWPNLSFVAFVLLVMMCLGCIAFGSAKLIDTMINDHVMVKANHAALQTQDYTLTQLGGAIGGNEIRLQILSDKVVDLQRRMSKLENAPNPTPLPSPPIFPWVTNFIYSTNILFTPITCESITNIAVGVVATNDCTLDGCHINGYTHPKPMLHKHTQP